MQKKARENRPRPGPREGKNHSYENQQGHEAPGPAKLRRMHKPKEHPGRHDACRHPYRGSDKHRDDRGALWAYACAAAWLDLGPRVLVDSRRSDFYLRAGLDGDGFRELSSAFRL